MRLVAINKEHTLDVDRLRNGYVLDVGCRFFDFTQEIVNGGNCVVAIDPSREVVEPNIKGVIFEQCALVGTPTPGGLMFCDNADAAHLVHDHRGETCGVPQYKVPCSTVTDLLTKYCLSRFEAVKLDCEGAEFEILRHWPGPVADQVTVAFHDFVNPTWCATQYPKILEHMSQWYEIVQHLSYVRHGHPVPCFWDTLFVLK